MLSCRRRRGTSPPVIPNLVTSRTRLPPPPPPRHPQLQPRRRYDPRRGQGPAPGTQAAARRAEREGDHVYVKVISAPRSPTPVRNTSLSLEPAYASPKTENNDHPAVDPHHHHGAGSGTCLATRLRPGASPPGSVHVTAKQFCAKSGRKAEHKYPAASASDRFRKVRSSSLQKRGTLVPSCTAREGASNLTSPRGDTPFRAVNEPAAWKLADLADGVKTVHPRGITSDGKAANSAPSSPRSTSPGPGLHAGGLARGRVAHLLRATECV